MQTAALAQAARLPAASRPTAQSAAAATRATTAECLCNFVCCVQAATLAQAARPPAASRPTAQSAAAATGATTAKRLTPEARFAAWFAKALQLLLAESPFDLPGSGARVPKGSGLRRQKLAAVHKGSKAHLRK
eukprot:1158264-Pelagomonas_calceolata.AAC.12